MHQQAFQLQAQVLSLQQAERKAELAVIETQTLFDQKVAIILLTSEGYVFAQWRVGEGILPIQVKRYLLQLFSTVARSVETADDRTHAGAGDRVNRDIHRLKLLENADVREPTCPAAR